MNISFPINKLLNRDLTADDFTICMLLKEKKYGLLKKYVELIKNNFYESLERLKEKGYVIYPEIDNIIPIKEIKVTEEFNNIVAQGDNFEEFYELFPTKVTRPDGTVDYLRINKIKCKTKYKKLVGKNLFKHDHIMDCLRYEVSKKEKTKNMAYFKRMYNWLDSEEYKKYEEELHTIAEGIILSNTVNQYGTSLS